MNNNISIRQIADDIMEHPLLRDLTLEAIVKHTVDFMRKFGSHFIFTDKFATVKAKDYRATLPCDFYRVIQVKDHKNGHCLRHATSTFHADRANESLPERATHIAQDDTDPSYKIQGNTIFTSSPDIEMRIAYRAIETDKDGYPLLPDNSVFTNALEAYIKLKRFTMLFDMAQIPLNVFQQAQQDYAWAAGQCHVEGDRLTLDQMQSLSNSLNTLLSRPSEQRNAFETLGAQEQRHIH